MKNYEIYNEDCMKVITSLKDKSINGVITDPPYGMDYQSNRVSLEKRKDKIQNDEKPFVEFFKPLYEKMADNSFLIVFCRWDSWNEFQINAEKNGFSCKEQIVWDKIQHGTGDLKGSPGSRHEIALFLVKGRYLLPGSRPQTVISCQKVNPIDMCHPNEKPLKLMESLIDGYTKEGDVIFDPFMGSAPVGMATILKNRYYIGCEIDKKYFNISKKRLDDIGILNEKDLFDY